MKSIIPIVLMIAVVAAIGFAAVKINGENAANAISEQNGAKNTDIRTYTKAVCEDKGAHVYCKDEFFVNCNGKEWIAKENSECDGIKIPLPSAMGAAVFDPGWKDPRE